MRTLKISSLSNFPICSTVLLIIVTMLYIISWWLTNLIIEDVTFDPLHPLYLLHPASGNHTVSSLHLWALVFIVGLNSTCKWDHSVYTGLVKSLFRFTDKLEWTDSPWWLSWLQKLPARQKIQGSIPGSQEESWRKGHGNLFLPWVSRTESVVGFSTWSPKGWTWLSN